MKLNGLWRRLQQIVIHNILHLDDTPHRIAWGVFIGAMVAFTPTLGFQIVIYLAVAALLRSNQYCLPSPTLLFLLFLLAQLP